MRRATTPTHIIAIPSNILVGDITDLLLTYKQDHKIILTKRKKDVTIKPSENKIYVDLSQLESTQFKHGYADVQIRIKTNNKVLASQIIAVEVKPVLSTEEL